MYSYTSKSLKFAVCALGTLGTLVESTPITTSSTPTTGLYAVPTGSFGFRYYIDSTIEYASAVASAAPTTFAAPYSELSTLVPDVSTTTWGNWNPNDTATATDSEDPYGQYAWSKLWEVTEFANFSTGLYSTTVSPTPIPTESLVLPPEDPVERAFDNLGITFPKDFILGVAGSAAQIEGAIAEEGRSPTVMDYIEIDKKKPENYVTNENYYLYKQDIARLAAIGVEYYSFSIPWTRILPFVFPGTPVNQQGIDHYDDLINTVLEYGLKPIITLTHFDSPAQISSPSEFSEFGIFNMSGGFPRDDFVDIFVNYGKIVMTHYADRVPIWIVFNEPLMFAENALGVKHVVQATAQLHDFYHNEIKGSGKVGIKFSNEFGYPTDPMDPEHIAAADRFNDMEIGMFADPLFNGRDWPETFKNTSLTLHPNLSWTEEELAAVKGKSDFLGIDSYTYTPCSPLNDVTVEECQADKDNEFWPSCSNQTLYDGDGWKQGYRSQSYVYITPKHYRVVLNYLWQRWGAPVLLTEFGFPEWREGEKDLGDQLYDLSRSIYYRSFLTAALEAVNYDGVDVIGALGWSFADNWEFGDYGQQFGMQVVNRTTQERYYKKSLFDYVKFIKDNRED